MKPPTLATWLYVAVILDGFTTFLGLTYYPQIWEYNTPFRHTQPIVLFGIKFALATIGIYLLARLYRYVNETGRPYVHGFLGTCCGIFTLPVANNVFQIAYWSLH